MGVLWGLADSASVVRPRLALSISRKLGSPIRAWKRRGISSGSMSSIRTEMKTPSQRRCAYSRGPETTGQASSKRRYCSHAT